MVGDSSTVAVRSVEAVLKGEDFDPFLTSFPQRLGATICNTLPHSLRKSIMGNLSGMIGSPFSESNNLNTDELTGWVTRVYPEKQYDAIIIGAPSGGAAHLGSLLGAPFLTQHFLLGFKGSFPMDDSRVYLDKCINAARTIVKNNDNLHTIIHYDPLHDRFLVNHIGCLRLKLIALPDTYRDFIRMRLKPNGTLVLLGCNFPWLQYQIDKRVNFQLGGLGGVNPDEYYNGSERIEKFISQNPIDKSKGSHAKWLLEGFPLLKTPESEWGLISSFADDIRTFVKKEGYQLVELDLRHPDELSSLMFQAFGNLISREYPDSISPIFLDSFTNSSPSFNRKICARPLWLPFICGDSFEFAVKILDREPSDTTILLALHPSFSDPFDLTPLDKWLKYLSRFKKVVFIGVNRRAYPSDFTSFFKFHNDTVRYARKNFLPLKSFFSANELTVF